MKCEVVVLIVFWGVHKNWSESPIFAFLHIDRVVSCILPLDLDIKHFPIFHISSNSIIIVLDLEMEAVHHDNVAIVHIVINQRAKG